MKNLSTEDEKIITALGLDIVGLLVPPALSLERINVPVPFHGNVYVLSLAKKDGAGWSVVEIMARPC